MVHKISNKPAEVSVDEDGIGACLSGVLNYYIRWSEIRRIQVDVIRYGQAGAEAFWAIDGERTKGSPAFFAPVEVIGGNSLTARLRSISGFNDAAFQRARAAEARGEAGTFLCWRKP